MEPLEWNEAQHKAKLIQELKKAKALKEKQQQEENIQLAKDDLWEAMRYENFRYRDFEDICNDYDLDEDDLINAMI